MKTNALVVKGLKQCLSNFLVSRTGNFKHRSFAALCTKILF